MLLLRDWQSEFAFNTGSQSTVEFNAGFDPGQRTPEETQFVNLLKSKWILERMEESSHLKAKGTASLWTSALMELKWVGGECICSSIIMTDVRENVGHNKRIQEI